MNTSITTPLRRIAATVIGTGAIAAGVMAMSVPVANATAKTEAQQECGSEDPRDVYTSTTDANGNVTETCCYHSGLVVELIVCRTWVNGKYVSQEQPPAPTGKPGVTPLPTAPNDGVHQPGPKPKPASPAPVTVAPRA